VLLLLAVVFFPALRLRWLVLHQGQAD